MYSLNTNKFTIIFYGAHNIAILYNVLSENKSFVVPGSFAYCKKCIPYSSIWTDFDSKPTLKIHLRIKP